MRRQRRISSVAVQVPIFLVALVAARTLLAQASPAGKDAAHFVGTQSCTGSGCHGGAAAHQNQYLVWSTRDFHSLRPFATLTTARSKQIADELRIADPTRDARCTTCHAPLAQVPAPLQAVVLNAKEGVSCESCHGPAERWLGSHTRPDYSRADRVASGMRDLKNLYVRANTCVACHQTVELPLLRAGHPELIFELDGQSVTEPKHWRVERDAPGPQAWLVGQAAALREMSWQLARERGADEKLTARWQALRWLLVKVELLGSGAKAPTAVQSAADELARRAAAMTWSDALTRQHLRALADSAADFRDGKVSAPMHAHRAERLVLALDRLVVGLDLEKGTKSPKVELERLFMLAQSVPDFEPERFAAALESFAARVR